MADRLAWIGIYPIDRSQRWGEEFLDQNGYVTDQIEIYNVRVFEMEKARFSEDVWFCEKDLTNICDEIVAGAAALEAVLLTHGLHIKDLKMPSETTYPI